MNRHEVDIQRDENGAGMPDDTLIERWCVYCLEETSEAPGEVCVRIVGEEEIRELNDRFRHRDGATNVLSFSAGEVSEDDRLLLGDVVICAPVVAAEAQVQGKSVEAHFAHLVIHGILHLQDHDHSDDDQAREMEAIEIRVMQGLGYGNPYA